MLGKIIPQRLVAPQAVGADRMALGTHMASGQALPHVPPWLGLAAQDRSARFAPFSPWLWPHGSCPLSRPARTFMRQVQIAIKSDYG